MKPHKPGPKIHTFAVTPSTSSATAPPSSSTNTSANTTANANVQPSANPSMAPAALPLSSSTSSTTSGPKFPGKKGKNGKFSHQPLDENDPKLLRKRKAREEAEANFKPVESFDRHRVSDLPSQDNDSQSDGLDFIDVAPSNRPAKKVRKTGKIILNTKTKTHTRETRQGSTRPNNYDSEENNLSSPTALGFHPHLAPGSTSSSRAATPSVSSRQPRRKPGAGLRVKSSPMKKKGGTSAGIPRSGERNSPVGNGISSATQDVVDNDDFCSACGGNGDLVCCDGHNCPRSFHFKCVDPPLINDLPDEWFCNECLAPQRPVEDYPGLFGHLFFHLDSKCPRAFSLPAPIRDYFEHVKTGNEGEYEEIQPPKAKNPKGWEETPDYFRLKDAKGNAIFCHDCGGQAEAPARSIINCTFCGLYWHMDCLPVPLAREPGPGRSWRCPAHVDDVLSKLPELLGPAHRFRRIKGASVIRPALFRGTRNNGYIEIENEPSDDEQRQDFYEQKEYGHVYRLPERGIKLDFITKVKRTGGGFQQDLPNKRLKHRHIADNRSVEDIQAALNLISIGLSNPLSNTFLSELPLAAVLLLAHSSADTIAGKKLTKAEKKNLEDAIEILKARLVAASEETPIGSPELLANGNPVPSQAAAMEDERPDAHAEMLM